MAWLSVLMPTYNGAEYIRDALESIAVQRDEDIEVVAVDDGSSDSTLEILQEFSIRLPLRIVRCAHVGNWVANTNSAASHAAGTYLSILHQDDCWLPGRAARLRAILEQSPGIALLIHPARFLDGSGKALGTWHCPFQGLGIVPRQRLLARLLVQNFLAMPAPLFHGAAFREVGGLNEGLWYTADWDLWLKLAAVGSTYHLGQPLCGFRLHAQSQTLRRSGDVSEYRRQLEEVFERHFEPWQAPSSAKAATHRAARLSLAVNTALAEMYHGIHPPWHQLAYRLLAQRPSTWYRFLRDSRIVERVASRLRADLKRGKGV